NSGLAYYLYRYYDSKLQRWLNQDPIGEAGGLNLYAFVDNNPLMFVDPYGLALQDPVGPPGTIPVIGDPGAGWRQGQKPATEFVGYRTGPFLVSLVRS